MSTDRLFYVLLQSAPSIVLELLNMPDSQSYKFEAIEVKEAAFRFDGVLRPDTESAEQPTIFVEVQFQKDAVFYHRLFSEIFLFLKQNPQVQYWQAIVLFEKQSRETGKQQPFRLLLDSPQVHRVYLSDLQQAPSNSVGIGIIQLLTAKPNNAITKAKQLIARTQTDAKTSTATQTSTSRLSPTQIIELVETIIVSKFPDLTREAVATMLELDELKQTRVYKDALQEGRQEGRQEGQQEGRWAAYHALTLKLLAQKLGELSQDERDRIQALSSQQLEALSDRLLNIETHQDLTNCLSNL